MFHDYSATNNRKSALFVVYGIMITHWSIVHYLPVSSKLHCERGTVIGLFQCFCGSGSAVFAGRLEDFVTGGVDPLDNPQKQ